MTGLKGTIEADHIPKHKYQLVVVGLPTLDLTYVSGIEDTLDVVDLPDRTKASGGRRGPVEMTVRLPLHHTVQQAAMEAWYREGQDPVLPTYKKPATLIWESLTGTRVRSFSFPDLFVGKRVTPEGEMSNEGEMTETEWMLHASDILPI